MVLVTTKSCAVLMMTTTGVLSCRIRNLFAYFNRSSSQPTFSNPKKEATLAPTSTLNLQTNENERGINGKWRFRNDGTPNIHQRMEQLSQIGCRPFQNNN